MTLVKILIYFDIRCPLFIKILMINYLAKYAYFTNKFDFEKTASEHKQDLWRAMNNTYRDVHDVISYSPLFHVISVQNRPISAHSKHISVQFTLISNILHLNPQNKIYYLPIPQKNDLIQGWGRFFSLFITIQYEWRRWESNPRPEAHILEHLRV